jgi:hypothetical protein
MASCEEPVWQPLIDLAAKVVDDFMLMFTVDLEDDRRLYAYKHYWTRQYVYVGDDGEVFGYLGGDPCRYVECNPTWLLGQATASDPRHTAWREWRDPE